MSVPNNRRPCQVSRIELRSSSNEQFQWDKTYDIELEKYNSAEETTEGLNHRVAADTYAIGTGTGEYL